MSAVANTPLLLLPYRRRSCAVPERFQRAITRCYSKFSKELEEMDEVFMGQEWKSEKEMKTGNFYSHMSKQTYEGR